MELQGLQKKRMRIKNEQKKLDLTLHASRERAILQKYTKTLNFLTRLQPLISNCDQFSDQIKSEIRKHLEEAKKIFFDSFWNGKRRDYIQATYLDGIISGNLDNLEVEPFLKPEDIVFQLIEQPEIPKKEEEIPKKTKKEPKEKKITKRRKKNDV